jgi:hypothetical protein
MKEFLDKKVIQIVSNLFNKSVIDFFTIDSPMIKILTSAHGNEGG